MDDRDERTDRPLGSDSSDVAKRLQQALTAGGPESKPAPRDSTQSTPEGLLLGQIALEWKLLQTQQLMDCIKDQEVAHAAGRDVPLGDLLKERGLLRQEDLERLAFEQRRRSEALPDLPRYEFRERAGEGATAVVYRAWDRQLNRLVAIKILREAPGMSEVARQRFRREAQTAAGLSHPHVVQVHDAGEKDGRLYLVMEMIEGRPLSGVLQENRDSIDPLLRLLEQTAHGVGAAHAKGIVHRDLKPSNILVTAAGEAKVGDFGLAHLVDSTTELTRTGSTLGTPLYMSPEQVEGNPRSIAPATDVYALGAMLYEILTGRPPHTGETTMEIYGKIVHEDPVPPRKRNPKASADLETIALKSLDKVPQRRYLDASEFAADLRRALAGEPIEGRPLPALVHWARKARRYRSILLPSAAALLLCLFLGAWAVAGAARKRSQQEALNLFERARPALEASVRYLYSRNLKHDELVARVDAAQGLIEAGIAKDPDIPLGRYLLGRAWEIKGWDDRAEESLRKAIELDRNFGPAHYQLGRLLLSRAQRWLLGVTRQERESRRVGAQRLAQEAAREIEEAVKSGNGFDDELQREVARAIVAHTTGDFDAVLRITRSAIDKFGGREGLEEIYVLVAFTPREGQLEALDQAIGLRPKYALALLLRAAARLENGDDTGAIVDCTEALEANPRMVEGRYNRGVARLKTGDVDGAIADFTEAVTLDAGYAHAWVNRGIARSRKGDPDGAVADFERAMALDPAHAEAWYNRGVVKSKRGDAAGAKLDFQRVLQLQADHARARHNHGLLLVAEGSPDDAFEEFGRALKSDPRYAEAFNSRGRVQFSRGNLEEAEEDFTDAIQVSPRFAEAHFNRGLVLLALRQAKRAAADFTKAIELNPSTPAAWAARARARLESEDHRGASEDAKKALQLGPGDDDRREMEALLQQLGKEK